MRQSRLTLPAALALAVALAGCNAGRQAQPLVDPTGPAAHMTTQTPEGAGCSGAIGRYRSVAENDLAMGHVNRGVYDQIQGEIGAAAAACAAGEDSRALSLLRASKARHGYPG